MAHNASRSATSESTGVVRTRILIVGSGFAGLGMAIRFRKQGVDDFVIIESADDIGGTWRDNTYPGAACDVPTHMYSFSFEPRTQWKRLYSYQPEIFDYLLELTDKYALRPNIDFGVRMTGAHWDDKSCTWRVTTVDGVDYVAQYLVSAIGALHIPSIPDLPGLDDFDGPVFHSSRWDHDVSLAGKRVAVIGTGASAVQFIPRIVGEVESLTVYQRTPPWVLPRANVEFGDRARQTFGNVPGARFLFRNLLYWFAEMGAFAMTRRPSLLSMVARMGKRHIADQITDPVLREKVTPTYRPGCKRLLGSDQYYPALAEAKSEVVTDSIGSVSADGITTTDGSLREADVIILGTGFKVFDAYTDLDVTGRGGVDLTQRWRTEGVQAFLGITMADAPNAFFLLGPNTGLGHNSIIFMIESQIRYAADAIIATAAQGASGLVPSRERQDRFNDELQTALSRSVWNTGGCESWYLDSQGKNRTLWSGFTWEYWLRTRRVDLDDFELITAAPPAIRRSGARERV